MANKFGSRNEKKESPSGQRYDQKPGRGNDSDNVSSYQQKDHGRSMAGNSKSKDKELGADGGSKSNADWLADNSQSKEGKWVSPEVTPKKGCFPKLFVLLMPFMVLGAYLYLAS